jgi:glycosyltransferase involved in cell wall biosynthesis
MRETIVSVAMATYNGSAYLREQLESIAAQTRPPDELVVSDDRSSDETLAILREFASGAPFRINLYQQPAKLGYPQNFSAALEQCSGKFVFLCDQDDVWMPEKIDSVLDCFHRAPQAVLVIHDLEICRSDLTAVGQTKIDRLANDYDLQRDYMTGAAMAVRGEFLRLCLPIPNLAGIGHDGWLNRCALAVKRKEVHHKKLTLFRRHDNNASPSYNPDSAGARTTRPSLLFSRFVSPTRLTAFHGVPTSPWSKWLREQGDNLISKCYVTPIQLVKAKRYEEARAAFMNERRRILQKTRRHRLLDILKLLRSGGYTEFRDWRIAFKDLCTPRLSDS